MTSTSPSPDASRNRRAISLRCSGELTLRIAYPPARCANEDGADLTSNAPFASLIRILFAAFGMIPPVAIRTPDLMHSSVKFFILAMVSGLGEPLGASLGV
jgi:hypothetical protein